MSTADRPTEGTNVAEDAEDVVADGAARDGMDVDEAAADADLAELGFEPAVSATGTDGAEEEPRSTGAPTSRPRWRRRALRRKASAFAVLAGALVAIGGAYATFALSSGASDSGASAASIARGKQLFDTSCITCHGANLQGVENQGPTLIGVGGAAAYFQVSTGRMPATGEGANEQRKTAKFDDAETRAIADYVQSVGGGPEMPTGNLRGPDSAIAEGGELFRINCASCHGVTGKGAPLSAGKYAPSLNDSTDEQLYAAMVSGPESMPVFSNNQLTLDQKKAIIAYVQTIKASNDPGGSGIDRIGPVSEAIVIWVCGVGLLMIVILWIGAKTQ
jgi:ubiquinol-cytochrome c reductase cytochrome c subunit